MNRPNCPWTLDIAVRSYCLALHTHQSTVQPCAVEKVPRRDTFLFRPPERRRGRNRRNHVRIEKQKHQCSSVRQSRHPSIAQPHTQPGRFQPTKSCGHPAKPLKRKERSCDPQVHILYIHWIITTPAGWVYGQPNCS